MRKRAFTLIELLVVIAIIAILAAILFPVFAQAKASAKASASLSNNKQINLAALQYANDYDDNFPIAQVWNANMPINGYQVTTSGKNFNSWRTLVHPYMKNLQIYRDPSTGAPFQNPNFAPAPFLNDLMYGQFAMNHMFMAPMKLSGSKFVATSTSGTRPANPADTVYFVQQYSVFSEANLNWQSATSEYSYIGMVDAPDCNGTPADLLCADNWGQGSAWETTLGLPEAAGGRTGGVTARVANGVNVTFADGHAKRMNFGALAAGTNWSRTRAASTVGVVPAQIDRYLWDLD